MSTREIEDHVKQIYGVEISPQFVSRATEQLHQQIMDWQSRPLERVYPVVFVDGLRVAVRTEKGVLKKCVYTVLGIGDSGRQEVLGLWVEETEGARVWARGLFMGWVRRIRTCQGLSCSVPTGSPRAGPLTGARHFCQGMYQGTHIDSSHTRVNDLVENISNASLTRADQRAELDALQTLNRQHAAAREEDSNLQARLESFELAFRMQMEAQDTFDISKEPESVRSVYGDTLHGRQMLIARRLSERGVRVVQVWHGAGQPWDSHSDIKGNHARLAHECDQAVAALLKI